MKTFVPGIITAMAVNCQYSSPYRSMIFIPRAKNAAIAVIMYRKLSKLLGNQSKEMQFAALTAKKDLHNIEPAFSIKNNI